MTTVQSQHDKGPAALDVPSRDGSRVWRVIVPSDGCRAFLRLRPRSGIDAKSDGEIFIINGESIEFSQSGDELAIAIGHELAHDILEHQRRLTAAKTDRRLLRNARRIREAKCEADYVGIWPPALVKTSTLHRNFWHRFGKRQGLPIGDETHRPPRSGPAP